MATMKKNNKIFPPVGLLQNNDFNIIAAHIHDGDAGPTYLSIASGPMLSTVTSFGPNVQLTQIRNTIGGGEYVLYAVSASTRKVLAIRVVRFKGEPSAFTRSRIEAEKRIMVDRQRKYTDDRVAATKLATDDESVLVLLIEIYGTLVSVGLTGTQQAAWAAMDKSRVAAEKAFAIIAPRANARQTIWQAVVMAGGGWIAAAYLVSRAIFAPAHNPKDEANT